MLERRTFMQEREPLLKGLGKEISGLKLPERFWQKCLEIGVC